MKHLFIIEDGEVLANELFATNAERAQFLLVFIQGEGLGDRNEFAALLAGQDMEAITADYPEGVSPSLPGPEDRFDGIKDWLAEQGVDVYIDTLDTSHLP